MYIKSKVDKDLLLKYEGHEEIIKANTVTHIDNFISAKKVKEIYGDRIEILAEHTEDEIKIEPVSAPVIEEVAVEEETPVTEQAEEVKEEIVVETVVETPATEEVREEPKKNAPKGRGSKKK